MSKFAATVSAFGKEGPQRAEKIRRAIILKLFSSIILDSPVDTGRFRGNWKTTVGAPATAAVDAIDKGGALAIASILPNCGDGTGKDIIVYFANNLPYGYKLEFEGWSDQAPQGMVRKNVARITSLVNKAAQEGKL